MKFSVILLLLTSLSFPFTLKASEKIRLCYENVTVYPWITGDDKGLVIGELHLVEKILSIKFEMVRLPWKRCQIEAQNGNFEGIIAASYTDERSNWGVYPFSNSKTVDPQYRLHSDSFYIYTRKESPIKWKNGKLENLGTNEVGVQLGYSVGNDIKKLGYPIHSTFTDAIDLIKELNMGGINVAVLQDLESLRILAAHPELGNKIVRQEPPLKIADQYVLFTKKFFNNNPDSAKKIWKAISEARESREYKSMVENELKHN